MEICALHNVIQLKEKLEYVIKQLIFAKHVIVLAQIAMELVQQNVFHVKKDYIDKMQTLLILPVIQAALMGKLLIIIIIVKFANLLVIHVEILQQIIVFLAKMATLCMIIFLFAFLFFPF